MVLNYDIKTKQIYELRIDNLDNPLPLGSGYIQMPGSSPRLFVVGGYRQLYECFEIIESHENIYRGVLKLMQRSRSDHQRLHHSICSFGEENFVVTGSLSEDSCD